jgi:PilZ domain-containing protein
MVLGWTEVEQTSRSAGRHGCVASRPQRVVKAVAGLMMWNRLGHRHSSRCSVTPPFRYEFQGAPSAHDGAGQTRNLSERGACLELAEPFPPATRLWLILEASVVRLRLEAGVMWIDGQAAPGGGSLHGVHFLQVTPAQQQTLHTILHPFEEVGSGSGPT